MPTIITSITRLFRFKGAVTHRGNNSTNGSRGHVLSFRLPHQSHTQVLHVEHHPLQQSLLGVGPVLRQL